MKIQIIDIKTKKEKVIDAQTKRYYNQYTKVPTGVVKEMEINPEDINVFSMNKNTRLIGIDKKTYRLTLKSYKETKKELERLGILKNFDLSQNY